MPLSDVVPLLGALGIGSVLGQYVNGGSQRRDARAKVLTALQAVEDARWEPQDDPKAYARAVNALQSSALIARVPRLPIDYYISLTLAARWMSQVSWEQQPDPEVGGGISASYADVVQEGAGLASTAIWSPWRVRGVFGTRRIQQVERRLKAIDDDGVRDTIKRARQNARY